MFQVFTMFCLLYEDNSNLMYQHNSAETTQKQWKKYFDSLWEGKQD